MPEISWLPIDTAPKDGTYIMVPTRSKLSILVVSWVSWKTYNFNMTYEEFKKTGPTINWGWGIPYSENGVGTPLTVEPEYWAPLPATPYIRHEQEGG